jgi:hypothetical protein
MRRADNVTFVRDENSKILGEKLERKLSLGRLWRK